MKYCGDQSTITIHSASYHELKCNLMNELKLGQNFSIKYCDDENEWMMVGSDQEVGDALRSRRIIFEVCDRATS